MRLFLPIKSTLIKFQRKEKLFKWQNVYNSKQYNLFLTTFHTNYSRSNRKNVKLFVNILNFIHICQAANLILFKIKNSYAA